MSVQFVRRLKLGMIIYFSFLTSPESSTGGVLEFQSLSHRYTATREVTVTERTRTLIHPRGVFRNLSLT